MSSTDLVGEMWKSTLVLQGLLSVGLGALNYGPCRTVSTVPLIKSKWPGKFFVNVVTKNDGVRCMWVDRTLEGDHIKETFKRIENSTHVESTVVGNMTGIGHYRFSKELTPGNLIVFEAYWLWFKVPDLDCHFVCSNDPRLKSGHGSFFCESSFPDALEKNACKIKELAEANKFDVNDLMVVDNCNCPNIPVAYKSNCKKMSIQEYMKGC